MGYSPWGRKELDWATNNTILRILTETLLSGGVVQRVVDLESDTMISCIENLFATW